MFRRRGNCDQRTTPGPADVGREASASGDNDGDTIPSTRLAGVFVRDQLRFDRCVVALKLQPHPLLAEQMDAWIEFRGVIVRIDP